MGLDRIDPCSFSEPEKIITKHISLDWTVDFWTRSIRGSATYRFHVLERNLQKIHLDIDMIEISHVHLIIAKMEIPINFSITESGRDIGDILTLEIPKEIHCCGTLIIRITYETSQTAKSLYWEITSFRKHPSVFSECKPIGARSLLPCQDTPAVKFTYTAMVDHPPELIALMSAPNRTQYNNGHSTFEQPVPIPSYLLAIAVGKFVSRPLGPRSNVWAEEKDIDSFGTILKDTSKMLDIAIEICGPYVWKQFDILVLPWWYLSLRGITNACLTFITGEEGEGVLNVLSHQIAHHWAGNLVTNKNFQHSWLNEGFATFIEGKIMGRLRGDKERDFEDSFALLRLKELIDKSPEISKLLIDLSDTHPNEAFSKVPYIKGSLFLWHLEDTFGGPTAFEQFIRNYFDHFKYQSIDSTDFKEYLCQYYSKSKYANKLKLIDWDKWLNSEGMPPVMPRLDYSLSDGSSELANT